ncbi:hypothetical protein [Amycolatopsis vastitatis]|uniref:hypothetical protein n=1 Tax=Amycolatopsis vastitatis TaxID=1905142 RepID=UPI0011778D86|nr:hypothetical protein [Amycolatopsis vastitatis]
MPDGQVAPRNPEQRPPGLRAGADQGHPQPDGDDRDHQGRTAGLHRRPAPAPLTADALETGDDLQLPEHDMPAPLAAVRHRFPPAPRHGAA